MKNFPRIAFVLLALTGLTLANPAPEAASSPAPTNVAMAIRTELESHGDRVMGRELYRWTTRLEGIEGCRAQFTVRIANNLSDNTVHVENISFSLGAVDEYSIEIKQNHWLQIPCAPGQNCIFSTSTCTRRSKDGIEIDCSTPSQKLADAFSLQMDGNPEAAERLQTFLRQAVDACTQPKRVTF